MKVLVLSVRAPFTHGGAEELRDHLVRNLNLTPGVRAASMSLPFSWDPWTRLPDEMLIARGLRLEAVDRVIPIKFPAYLVEHEARTPWIVHQYRQAYDMWDSGYSNLPDTPDGRRVRDLIPVRGRGSALGPAAAVRDLAGRASAPALLRHRGRDIVRAAERSLAVRGRRGGGLRVRRRPGGRSEAAASARARAAVRAGRTSRHFRSSGGGGSRPLAAAGRRGGRGRGPGAPRPPLPAAR